MKNKIKNVLLLGSVLALATCGHDSSSTVNDNAITGIVSQNWASICTTGSPAGTGGCYGDLATTAFSNLDNLLRGYTTYANINTTLGTPANSVFVKAFLAGTNTPVSGQNISVSVAAGMARCTLFTQQGIGVNGIQGLSAEIPSSGNYSNGGPQAPQVNTINNATANILYASTAPSPPNPIYLLCVGVSTTDGATPETILNNITAI